MRNFLWTHRCRLIGHYWPSYWHEMKDGTFGQKCWRCPKVRFVREKPTTGTIFFYTEGMRKTDYRKALEG